MGAVVLGLSAYAGYRTYDAYNGVSESELLLANAEALAIQEFMGCDCYTSIRTCRIYVGSTGGVKLRNGKILEPEADGYMEYKAARMEQEAYERRLERCKTKEEAQRLQVNEMNGNLAELKSIVNNPNIPKSEKLKEAQRIMGNTFRAVESFTRFVKSTEYRDLPTEEEIVETSIEKGQVAEDSNDTEMSEQLTSDTTVSVDEAAKIVNDSKRDLQLSDVHQIEKDVIEEMKDIEIKHFGEKKSSVRIDITV